MTVNLHSILILAFIGFILAINLRTSISELSLSKEKKRPGIAISWQCYLVITQLLLFWEVSDLLDKEVWKVTEFLLLMAGPLLIVFATSYLQFDYCDDESLPEDRYLSRRRPFFISIALVHGWMLLSDIVFHCFAPVALGTVISLLISLSLLFIRSYRWHISGSVAMWITLGYITFFQLI